jgi:hypothetical protein
MGRRVEPNIRALQEIAFDCLPPGFRSGTGIENGPVTDS